jgi:hypothetical protein
LLLAHWRAWVQACPGAFKQTPARQALIPPHTGFVSVPRVVMSEHVPLAPTLRAAEQAWHTPLHAVLQQKPSTQLPALHWLSRVQADPCAFFSAHVRPAVQ